MSDALKLLTPEELEGDLPLSDTYLCLYSERARATTKAACERLARVERCPTCKGAEWISIKKWCGGRRTGYMGYRTARCPDCKGHPGMAYKDAMDVLRTLGKGRSKG